MNRPRLIHGIKITWTAFCGIATLLLVVLWVRSNYWVDQIFVPVTQSTYVCAGSMPNAFGVGLTNKSPTDAWAWLNMPAVEWLAIGDPSGVPWSGARFFSISLGSVMMPYWFGVLLSVVFAAVPWLQKLQWRFSLRTLLVATTIVAVLLGVAAWLRR